MAKNVFICKWKHTGSHWRIWVKGKPILSGEGDTLEAAQLALEQAIWNSYPGELDDIIPTIMEFDPPMPTREQTRKFFIPEIYKIYGDDRFELLSGNFPYGKADDESMAYVDSLYERGICRTCKHGSGKRTEVELKTNESFPATEGLCLFHCQIRAGAYIFSDRFISLLTPEEQGRLSFRKCQMPHKSQRNYYELTGIAAAENVGVKGLDAEGQECSVCGHRHFWIMDMNMDFAMQHFICRSDLPDPLPSCFAVMINEEISLCMTRERWDQIRGNKNARGLVSDPIGVVDEESCDKHPRLHTNFISCDTCSSWEGEKDVGKRNWWNLPASVEEVNGHPSIAWLKNELQNPQTITIVRQEDTLEHILEMAVSGEKIKEGKTISFRCPKCWQLGKIFITQDRLGIILPRKKPE